MRNFESTSASETVEKQAPNYKTSGLLAKELLTVNNTVLKYQAPNNSCLPKLKYRFHVFKNDKQVDVLLLYNKASYLFGRDRNIADFPFDHSSISGQHAVITYLKKKDKIIPYLLDLDSSNGTYVNKEKIQSQRYFELRAGDVVVFGFSTRENVFINEDLDDEYLT